MERTPNIALLKQWVDENGIALLEHKTKCSRTLLDRLVRGTYRKVLRRSTQRLICSATGHSVDELFPLAKAEMQRSPN